MSAVEASEVGCSMLESSAIVSTLTVTCVHQLSVKGKGTPLGDEREEQGRLVKKRKIDSAIIRSRA